MAKKEKLEQPIFKIEFLGPKYWPIWLFAFILCCIAQLPASFVLRIGTGLGLLSYRFAKKRTRIARKNIQMCFPELSPAEQEALAKESILNTTRGMMEAIMAAAGQKHKFANTHTMIGLEHVRTAAEKGKGVILLGEHFTTLDMAGCLLGYHLPFGVLYRKDPNPLLAFLITKGRMRHAAVGIVRNDTRQLLRELKKGRIIWYAPDQDYGAKHSVFVPFFGVPAAQITATARLAKLTGAAVIPFAHYRDNKGHYTVECKAPLENFPTGDDIKDATTVSHTIETAIRKKPEQYMWVHRRFKTLPEGGKRKY